ncbi:hypothetical protein IJJ39_02685 [Candidatus Saccharibacteria bacterium]|nr:hypothetical protein [Candidatus Saccharibacteria bacterium]
MSVFVPVIILVLAMLIQGSMQLSQGIFSIFYHSTLAKFSHKKTDDLSLSFLLGVEFFFAIIFMSIYAAVNFLFLNLVDYSIVFWIFAGIAFAIAICLFCFYFRKTIATALFIPRRVAASFVTHATHVRTRRDAFALGFFSNLPELIFTLPLIIIVCFLLTTFPSPASCFIIIPYIIIAVIPLFVIRTLFSTRHNLAFVTRLRARLKPVIRTILSLSFITIAALLIYLGVIYG